MKSSLCFVLLLSTVAVNGVTDEKWQLFDECDRTVGKGVGVCLQYFSPIQFLTDLIGGNKDSLCCSHFKHDVCIRGVRDAVKVAKSANLCPNSFSDSIISTLTDSPVNNYIVRSCQSFNTEKCVMDSVGEVVNTIQGFFAPQQQQQQKPVIPQVIDNIFNRGNTYTNNGNNDRSSLLNIFREVSPRVTSTENPLINKSIRDLLDRQYIPEASVLKPISDIFSGRRETTTTESPFRSLFSGLANPRPSGEPSILDSFGALFNTDNNSNNNSFLSQSFKNIFGSNGTNDGGTIVKDITDAINRN